LACRAREISLGARCAGLVAAAEERAAAAAAAQREAAIEGAARTAAAGQLTAALAAQLSLKQQLRDAHDNAKAQVTGSGSGDVCRRWPVAVVVVVGQFLCAAPTENHIEHRLNCGIYHAEHGGRTSATVSETVYVRLWFKGAHSVA
jgi:hypothetical protein